MPPQVAPQCSQTGQFDAFGKVQRNWYFSCLWAGKRLLFS